MAELSGFTSITATGLATWEALVAVASYLKLDIDVREPNPFGWGFAHCVRGVESRAHLVDTETGARADPLDLSPDHRKEFADLEDELAHRFELTTLAGGEPRLEGAAGSWAFPPLPDHDGARFEAKERKLDTQLDENEATAQRIRDWIVLDAFKGSQKYIVEACVLLGLPLSAVHEQLVERANRGDLSGIHEFVGCLPIQGLFTEVRVRAHLKRNFKFTRSDLMDFLTVATVLPFVDYAVVDNRTFNLITEVELERQGAKPLRRLSDLRDELECSVGCV
jgi:hypothetical protein